MLETKQAGSKTQPTQVNSTANAVVKQQKPFFILPTDNGEAVEELYVSTADGSVIPVTAEEAVTCKSIESVIRNHEPDVRIRHDYFVYQSYCSPETGWRWGRTKKQAEQLAATLVGIYGGSVKDGGCGSAHWLNVTLDTGPLCETMLTIYYTPEGVSWNGKA